MSKHMQWDYSDDTELYADDLPDDQREALRRYLGESKDLE